MTTLNAATAILAPMGDSISRPTCVTSIQKRREIDEADRSGDAGQICNPSLVEDFQDHVFGEIGKVGAVEAALGHDLHAPKAR